MAMILYWMICNPDWEIKFVNPGRVDKLKHTPQLRKPVINLSITVASGNAHRNSGPIP